MLDLYPAELNGIIDLRHHLRVFGDDVACLLQEKQSLFLPHYFNNMEVLLVW